MKTAPEQVSSNNSEKRNRDTRFAMRLSLFIGILTLAGKMSAYLHTGSSAVFSDAAESVVHVVAVAFAVFSLWLSLRPAVPTFHYGYERITFFSAGFEGAMIVLAAGSILFMTIQKWRHGLVLDNLGHGALLIVAAGVLNAALGIYLLRIGKRNHSLILEADGKHVLTDSWTSFGVVAGLMLVMITGWKPFDPLIAIAVAVNILWSGGRLLWQSVKGLLDYSDPEVGHVIRGRLDAAAGISDCNIMECAFAPQDIARSSRYISCFLTPWHLAKPTGLQLSWKSGWHSIWRFLRKSLPILNLSKIILKCTMRSTIRDYMNSDLWNLIEKQNHAAAWLCDQPEPPLVEKGFGWLSKQARSRRSSCTDSGRWAGCSCSVALPTT